METYNLQNDVKAFGIQVKTFSTGIKEAFDSLIKMLPGGFNRSYYGISTFDKTGNILYYATEEETFAGEAEKYNCDSYIIDSYIIEKGEYLTVTVHKWVNKTDTIKDVFHEMMQDSRVDKKKPCVEWYKNGDEMTCMVRLNTGNELNTDNTNQADKHRS